VTERDRYFEDLEAKSIKAVMDISGVASSGLHAVSGASNGAPPQQEMSNLFDSIDTGGSGSITQSQFEQAFQTKKPPAVFQKEGVDAIFAWQNLPIPCSSTSANRAVIRRSEFDLPWKGTSSRPCRAACRSIY
jgi:hypothetical protein